jgi:hypothetical protein
MVFVSARMYVARMAQTLVEFPVSPEPAAFNLAKVMPKLQAGVAST